MEKKEAVITGYTMFYLKRKDGKPTNEVAESDESGVGIPLEVDSMIIPIEMKEASAEYIKSIDNRVPIEHEVMKWYDEQKKK